MIRAIADADARMAADGYVRGSRTGDLAGDRLAAEAMQCAKCGNPGHEFLAYRNGRRHRCVVICRGCKRIEEF